jgi:curved DNA-binding protein CbpA
MEVEGTIRAAWTLPEDERRKIIKRLYKKWHPDKNFGNELVNTTTSYSNLVHLKSIS